MNPSKMFLGGMLIAACLAGQEPGARLTLAPSELLGDLRIPASRTPAADPAGEQQVRPAILNLVPPGDPIHLVDREGAASEWRTYRRPKVDAFSRDGEGVALRGYDVVSYLDQRAEKGTKGFSFEYHGVTWRFTSDEHRTIFTGQPMRYLPEYGGFCAYSAANGYPATADPRVYTVDGGKLYLFFDQAVQAVWLQDRRNFIAKADRNWPKLHR